MGSSSARYLFIIVLLLLPGLAFAQDATLTGTVKDTSGGVLPASP